MNQSELDRLFSDAYEELRRLAARVRAGDPRATLNPTALVNEAYLRLSRSRRLAVESEVHFKHIAARAMRRVLVDAARRRDAQRRGGGLRVMTYDDRVETDGQSAVEVIALDDALDALAKEAPRQAQVVELRFFGGLEVVEVAELLDVSAVTVSRDWRAARAWLAHELRSA